MDRIEGGQDASWTYVARRRHVSLAFDSGSFRSHHPALRTREEPETPLETLKKRYARGEISRDEFEQMK